MTTWAAKFCSGEAPSACRRTGAHLRAIEDYPADYVIVFEHRYCEDGSHPGKLDKSSDIRIERPRIRNHGYDCEEDQLFGGGHSQQRAGAVKLMAPPQDGKGGRSIMHCDGMERVAFVEVH